MIPLAQLLEQAWARALPGREAATRNEALRTFQSGSEGLVALKGVKRARATWGSRKHRGDAILQLTFERIGTEPMLANQGRFAVLPLIVPGVILLALTVDIAVVVGWLRRL